MATLPAETRSPPSTAVSATPRSERPGTTPETRQNPLAAFLGALVGLIVLSGFALAYLDPDLAPYLAPSLVLGGGGILWGASRIDARRLKAERESLSAENRKLRRRAEELSDSTWELRESEERYRSLIDTQGDLVLHADRDGRITFANAAFEQAFGVPADTPASLSPIPLPLAVGEERRATPDQGHDIVSRDIRLPTRSGPRWFAWVDIRMRDDRGVLGSVYSVARDITARKDVEEALDEARRRAEAASHAKSRFLATVSHEFRTPLNGILGLTGLLRETSLTADQETYARGVQSAAGALLALVDELLDFGRIEAGRLDLQPEPTNPETLLQEIAELLAARAHDKGIDIVAMVEGAMPASVAVDAARLRQVLVNLAGNAVKFTSRGGVSLAATVVAGDTEKVAVRFAVADSGPGVSREDAERIFEEFEQGDSALTRRHGGAGLGLAISRRIIRRMGGELTLAPRAGGGSVFAFTLELPVLAAATVAHSPLAGRRILIAMPDGAEPPILARALAEAGAEARSVATIHEATALIAAAAAAALPYDAVLVDRRLGDDPEAVLQVLATAAGAPVAAAALLAPSERGEIESLRLGGYAAYLVRPVRRSSLLKVVEAAITSRDFQPDPEDTVPRLQPPPARPTASLKVLLAEDNEISALLARAVLEGIGHSVTTVQNGEAAVREAVPGRFGAIILDLHMPGLDGIAAARAIRAAETAAADGRRAVILALTADVLPETHAEALSAGVDAVLEKPVSPTALRARLAELTGERPAQAGS